MNTLINSTSLKLSTGDALRALLGRQIHITTEIDLAVEAQVLTTRQQVYVDSIFPQPKLSMQSVDLLIATSAGGI